MPKYYPRSESELTSKLDHWGLRHAALGYALALLLLAAASGSSAATKPNIVLIFADDLGWRDVGFNGSDFYETPNLDRMVKEGISFSQAYASAGNCQPSRACLLAGQYTPRHQVYAVQSTERGPKELMRLRPVPNHPVLPGDNLTLAEALQAAGYATAHFGKWHVGNAAHRGTEPLEQGFDHMADYGHGSSGNAPDNPKKLYSITRAACEFIEDNKDRPFFVYVSHYAIHSALEARPESIVKFKAKPPGAQHSHALAAACIYDLDDAVGRLLAKLDELDLARNTLVIFTSDNGGTDPSSQEPLRGKKGCYYEGGIRVPCVARWPAVIRPGTRSQVPIINVDFYPTFLDVAAAPIPAGKTMDGESLLSLLRGGGSLRRAAIFWHFPGYLDRPVPRGRDPVFRTRPVSVIRKGDWKLHLYHEEWLLDGGREKLATNRAVELYNLARDPGERSDLAVSNVARRDELLQDLLGWVERVRAPMAEIRDASDRKR